MFFSYEILSCADAEVFDQYVLNVKLLGYLINLLCFKMQSRVRSSMCQLRFSICTNMQICSIRLIFGLIGMRMDWKYESTALFFLQSCGDILVHMQSSKHFKLKQHYICILSSLFSILFCCISLLQTLQYKLIWMGN